MGFSRISIILVAAAESYNLRCCIYLADHAEVRPERILCKWAEGSRGSPVREANAHCRVGDASLRKPCPGRGHWELHGFAHSVLAMLDSF